LFRDRKVAHFSVDKKFQLVVVLMQSARDARADIEILELSLFGLDRDACADLMSFASLAVKLMEYCRELIFFPSSSSLMEKSSR